MSPHVYYTLSVSCGSLLMYITPRPLCLNHHHLICCSRNCSSDRLAFSPTCTSHPRRSPFYVPAPYLRTVFEPSPSPVSAPHLTSSTPLSTSSPRTTSSYYSHKLHSGGILLKDVQIRKRLERADAFAACARIEKAKQEPRQGHYHGIASRSRQHFSVSGITTVSRLHKPPTRKLYYSKLPCSTTPTPTPNSSATAGPSELELLDHPTPGNRNTHLARGRSLIC